MKALYADGRGNVQVIDIAKPEITGSNDVIIQVTSCGICSSDNDIVAGTHPLTTYPRIIGHEFGGVVTAMGNKVSHVKKGDKVTIDPVTSCSYCRFCTTGRPNLCSALATIGVHRDGGFCEYFKAPSRNVYRFANQKIDEEVLGLAEPYSIGLQINYRAAVTHQDRVLVVGAGPIGLCAIQAAKARGAQVLVTDVIQKRIERALAMGADGAVKVTEEEHPLRWDNFLAGAGADVIIDTVCTPASLERAIDEAAFGGRIVNLSIGIEKASLIPVEITRKELTIVGSRLNANRFPEVVREIDCGRFTPQQLRTHTFPFTAIDEALELIRKHPEEVCKVILTH